ncbi:hypothetical protein BK133_23045 [Paenibacillus sp. FSL H8-0548]|uniref:integrase core domain-containing protein n=1 Tax=Paenibacillus sp. FSL H8-0548 TaxID=1920422 RepID=UPI00096DB0AC|nr:integrase core domain-containing protein [Paenibacillus sp. FSL H8-0548]OMF24419.1 hypothetical protein BK133_23045 [Paenibacillus sp. FSL H8-0548]
MISASDRQLAVLLIQEVVVAGAREYLACNILNLTQRTLQRWRNQEVCEDQRPHVKRQSPVNKLSDSEQQQIVAVINQPAFKSLPPSQIVPRLADQGTYIASESTFCRVMHQHALQHHRGRSAKPTSKPLTSHRATSPNQVWMWDITPSRSRPRVSNDNPYAESIFRTCKYRPEYPANGFESIDKAREWVLRFVRWYNTEHCHSGLNFLTPNQGLAKQIFDNRKQVYEAAKASHPTRWSGSTRNWSLEEEVGLNPERVTPIQAGQKSKN